MEAEAPAKSGVMPRKTAVASLDIEDLRRVTGHNQRAVLDSTTSCRDLEVAKEVYRLTKEECERGWLLGALSPSDIPCDAVLTRRFGVTQTSANAEHGTVKKIRPIDDFTESLANLTSSAEETIEPHSISVIAAGILLRLRGSRKYGRKEKLKMKTVDLRKAYKQLPLSEAALHDSYICVLNPDSMQPEIYQTLVLPFGAKPAVQGFCRVSAGLWAIGVNLFSIHWSVYFDDFVLVASEPECKHLDMIQGGLFSLLGWETSSEKDAGFSFVARGLGVEVCLGESHLGLLSIQNTEARKRELSEKINIMLEARGATAKDFECLAGRLIFAESQIFGRGAQQRMRVISHACKAQGFVAIEGSLAGIEL